MINESPNYLKATRQGLGLSLKTVAERAECSTTYLYLLERGYRPAQDTPTVGRIVKVLADATDSHAA